MDVGDDRDIRLLGDDGQRLGVVLAGHRHPDHLATRRRELGDLLQRRVDVRSQRRGHRLHAHRRIPTDLHRVVRVSKGDLAGLPARCQCRRRSSRHSQRNGHISSIAHDVNHAFDCGWQNSNERSRAAGTAGIRSPSPSPLESGTGVGLRYTRWSRTDRGTPTDVPDSNGCTQLQRLRGVQARPDPVSKSIPVGVRHRRWT